MTKTIMLKSIRFVSLFTFLLASVAAFSQTVHRSFKPGLKWLDTESNPINAHGGGVLFYENTYYWFGEHKGTTGNAFVGVRCYSSNDLYNWKNEGVALAVTTEEGSDIVSGCKIERPKVIHNRKTGKFIMYFHLELKDQGYDAARVGIAVADQPAGPYVYQKSLRPNAGKWPVGCHSIEDARFLLFNQYLIRDFEGGQYSRDMTLFVDDDDRAYHIFSSEGNATLHIAELSEDYLSHTGVYTRVAPGGYNEAPAIFKRESRYYMITSGCTGWDPNAARLFTSTNIMGPWVEFPNPCVGVNANKTFLSQSTFILPVNGKKNAYIYMGDRWNKNKLSNSLYVWLPVRFVNGLPVLEWMDDWSLDCFTNTYLELQNDIASGKELLGRIKVGENIGECPKEVSDEFRKAIQEAEMVKDIAAESEIADAIIALSNAAAKLQESIPVREINTLADGGYYLKVAGEYYLTNSKQIGNDKPLLLQTGKITESDEQIFNISKHPLTGRYKILSKLDGRNLNESCRIRNTWGNNDHLWRTMNIYFNGSGYAIQTDGNSFGMQWKLNREKLQIDAEAPFRVALENDEDFIFSIEPVSSSNSQVNIVENTIPMAFSLASSPTIRVKTDIPISVIIYTCDGLKIAYDKIQIDKDFSVSPGVYMVYIESEDDSWIRKVVVNY